MIIARIIKIILIINNTRKQIISPINSARVNNRDGRYSGSI